MVKISLEHRVLESVLHEVSGSENKSQWITVVYTHIEIYTHTAGARRKAVR